MHLQHFGLSVNPFGISPRLDFLYKSGAFEESMAHLVYGLDNSEAIVMISGAIGTGKTMAVQSFLSYLGSRYLSALITNTCVDGRELLKLILDDLNVPFDAGADKSDLIIAFKRFLISTGHEGKRTVIVIDEAQNLAQEVLEEIRQLTNLGQGEEQPVQIILVGQPELEAIVQRPELAQLKQRIRVHYKLAPLTRQEIEEYVDHRMEVAGGKSGVFGAKALDLIYRQSGGVPRVVNTLCAEALLSAFVAGRQKVEIGDTGEQAAQADANEPAKPVVRADTALSPSRPMAGAAGEARHGMAVPRNARPTPVPVTNDRSGRKPQRGGGAWIAAALVVVAVVMLVVTGQMRAVWSRLPFGADGAGRNDGAAADLAEAPIADQVLTNVTVAPVAAESLRLAIVDTSAAAVENPRATAAAMPLDTTPASAARRPVSAPGAENTEHLPAATDAAVASVVGGGSAGDTLTDGGGHLIHVSSFRTAGQAAAVAQSFNDGGLVASVREQLVRDTLWYRVYLGPFGSHAEAVGVATRLRDEGTITYYKVVKLGAAEGL